jgi:hypothetical protein
MTVRIISGWYVSPTSYQVRPNQRNEDFDLKERIALRSPEAGLIDDPAERFLIPPHQKAWFSLITSRLFLRTYFYGYGIDCLAIFQTSSASLSDLP